jgi:hypothetical protein
MPEPAAGRRRSRVDSELSGRNSGAENCFIFRISKRRAGHSAFPVSRGGYPQEVLRVLLVHQALLYAIASSAAGVTAEEKQPGTIH